MPAYLTDKAAPEEGRLFSPVFDRNCPPIIAALVPWLGKVTGTVLEIGSGSGQHAGALQLAFPQLHWQPSDPFPEHHASIAAWRAYLKLPPLNVLELDASSDWGETVSDPFEAVMCMNVIHISPIAVLEGILSGAAKTLKPGGLMIFYGPFKEKGAHTGEGNQSFDERLRAENPEWGIRDVGDVTTLAEQSDLTFEALEVMPANNRLLIFRKS